MTRRTKKVLLIVCLVVLVGLAIALLLGFFYARSLGSERNTPITASWFLTQDTSAALVVRWRPSDTGVLELSNRLAEAYDAARKPHAGIAERLGYFLLGFNRPSDVLTRPLPLELAAVVRYDPKKAAFHSYAVCSLSGLGGLLRRGASHLSWLSADAADRYNTQMHSDETIFVPRTGTAPPGPRLDRRDVYALFPPPAVSEACWAVVGNNIVVSRRARSMAAAVDRVKQIAAGGSVVTFPGMLPPEAPGIDARGVVLNQHGELACVLRMLGDLTGAPGLAEWIVSDEGMEDLSAIRRLALQVDVQPGDRIVLTVSLACTSYRSAERVCGAVVAALAQYRPPAPMAIAALPTVTRGELGLRITVTGIGACLAPASATPK